MGYEHVNKFIWFCFLVMYIIDEPLILSFCCIFCTKKKHKVLQFGKKKSRSSTTKKSKKKIVNSKQFETKKEPNKFLILIVTHISFYIIIQVHMNIVCAIKLTIYENEITKKKKKKIYSNQKSQSYKQSNLLKIELRTSDFVETIFYGTT